jgi:nucleoside-diphosphate-sugar epimerase/phosphohistidine swiveling domain-containing protein
VTAVAGDIRDLGAVTAAMAGCDVVVHFAWALEPLPTEEENRAVNVTGTTNVLTAMSATGCRRLVFSSSVMAYGSHPDNPAFLHEDDPLRPDARIYYAAQKAEVEALIAASGVEAVITRPAIALGSRAISYAARLFGMPALTSVRGVDIRWQLIHVDDVARFHADACFSHQTGTVNLAAPDVLTSRELADALHRPLVTLPRSAMDRALAFTWKHHLANIEPATLDGLTWPPVVDTTRLSRDWGFTCSMSGLEAAQDAGRVFERAVYLGARRVDAPWRMTWAPTEVLADLPPADDAGLVHPGPEDLRGELDSRIDPRFPTYSASNLSEAFPGPMSPLSLDIALTAIRGSGAAMAELLLLADPERTELSTRPIISAGHRLYVNVSVLRSMAAAMPGWSAEDIERDYLGHVSGTTERVAPSVGAALHGARVAGRMLPRVTSLRREADHLRIENDRLLAEARTASMLSDERLLSRLVLARALVVQAWNTSSFAAAVAGTAATLAGPHVSEEGALASGATLRHVQALAEATETDFPRLFDEAIAAIGHRGPGEGELANEMFEDRPDALLAAVRAASQQQPAPSRRTSSRDPRAIIARRALLTREHARDVSVRTSHTLRLLVRERGRRLAGQGALASAHDAFALTFDELIGTPADDLVLRTRRRWAERERLRTLELPAVFDGTWQPLVRDDALEPGGVLAGVGASPGVVTGRARVITDAFDADLEPGDILVAHVTDTGWTAFFAGASAVVTDVGARASHAAIVAREFGIPCVVGTHVGSTRIKDEMVIRVDGQAGTVTRVS